LVDTELEFVRPRHELGGHLTLLRREALDIRDQRLDLRADAFGRLDALGRLDFDLAQAAQGVDVRADRHGRGHAGVTAQGADRDALTGPGVAPDDRAAFAGDAIRRLHVAVN